MLVVIGVVVAVLVLGTVAAVVFRSSLGKCAQWAVDDARDAGQAPVPPPTPQVPSATQNSSKSVTHIGCDDRHSAPPTRP
jgi:hypothetical protein